MTHEARQTRPVVVTASDLSRPEPAASIEEVVRAYVDAAARRDYVSLCSHFSDAARVMARLEAADRGLRTDSCEAAMAHIKPPSISDEAKAALTDLAIELASVEQDRATVTVRATSDEATLLTLVREGGAWKIGVTIGPTSS